MTYIEARERFIAELTKRKAEHLTKNFPGLNHPIFLVKEGRKYDKVIESDNGSRRSYCWIDRATGDLLKGSWKCVTEKTPRGNIYRESFMDGTGPYGLDYLKMSNSGWGW
jgi:hypothetical protein